MQFANGRDILREVRQVLPKLLAVCAVLIALWIAFLLFIFGPHHDFFAKKYDQVRVGWNQTQLVELCGKPNEIDANVGETYVNAEGTHNATCVYSSDQPFFKDLLNSKDEPKTYVYIISLDMFAWREYSFAIDKNGLVTAKNMHETRG